MVLRKVCRLVIGDYVYIIAGTSHKHYRIIDIQPNEDDTSKVILTLRPIIEWTTRDIIVYLDDYITVY